MNKFLKGLLLAATLTISAVANAATYTYVGSFTTTGEIQKADGTLLNTPALHWSANPAVYSGVEAAALLFGGSSADYRTSTVSDIIDGFAWYDGWGDHGGKKFADTFKLDSTGLGYNGCAIAGTDCMFSAYSAYILDGFSATNYVFKLDQVNAVPLPAAAWLFGSALFGFAGMRKRKSA